MDVVRHSRYFQVGFGDALQQHFPGALIANDDLFQHSETGLISEYGRIEETFAPEVLEVIGAWLSRR